MNESISRPAIDVEAAQSTMAPKKRIPAPKISLGSNRRWRIWRQVTTLDMLARAVRDGLIGLAEKAL